MLLFSKHARETWTFLAICIVLTLPPVLTNWHSVLSNDETAQARLTPYPAQQIATWRELVNGLAQKPAAPNVSNDTGLGEFPDLFLVRLGESSTTGKLLSITCAVIGVASIAVLSYFTLRTQARRLDD